MDAKRFARDRLVVSLVGVTTVWAAVARAQDTIQPSGEVRSGRFSDVLQEVVVTATKNEERLDEVPLSITAYSQESMDARGVRDIRDLANQTPGLDISTDGQTRITIRGISSAAGAATSAVYIDDTPVQARNAALNYDGSTIPYIFDLERVEVLRGPQGTLFGSSSQGGAIRFITPTPSLTDYSTYARAAVNSVDGGGIGYEAGGALGGPIIDDVLGFRVSAYHREDAGWIDRRSWQDPANRDNDANRTESSVFRGALNYRPAEWLTIAPSLYVQQLKFHDRASLWTACPATTNAPVDPTFVPCAQGVSSPDDGKYLSYTSITQPSEDKFILPALRVTADFPAVSFTSVSSYFDRNLQQINDATHGNDRVSFGARYLFPIAPGFAQSITWQDLELDQRLFAQELRMNSTDENSRIRWTAGVYYSRGKLHSDLYINEPHYNALYEVRFGRTPQAAGVPPLVDGIARYTGDEYTTEETTAVFGSVDVKIVDALTLTLGARYSKDTLDFDITERGVSIRGGISSVSGSLSDKPFTPKVALAWQATEDSLYYASYAKGYRTGGVNKALPDVCNAEASQMGLGDARIYDPDEAKSYELGSKSSWFGGTLKYTASLFYTEWNEIQQQLRLQCSFSLVANTASATSKGFDLSIDYLATDDLLFGAAVGYTDATYDETIQIGTAPVVVAGQTLGATPWTVNFSSEYRFLIRGLDANVRAQYNYKSVNDGPFLFQNPASTSYEPGRYLGAAAKTLDLRVGVQFADVNVSLYAENALNNTDYQTSNPNFIGGPLSTGTTLRPRVIGLQAIARY